MTEKLGNLSVRPDLLTKEPMSEKEAVFSACSGYKLIDCQLLQQALETAQACGHSSLVITELDLASSRQGLVTQLAFICSHCGNQTSFTTSKFSVKSPNEFSVNNTLLQIVGDNAYLSLVEFLQQNENTPNLENRSKENIKSMYKVTMEGNEKGVSAVGGETLEEDYNNNEQDDNNSFDKRQTNTPDPLSLDDIENNNKKGGLKSFDTIQINTLNPLKVNLDDVENNNEKGGLQLFEKIHDNSSNPSSQGNLPKKAPRGNPKLIVDFTQKWKKITTNRNAKRLKKSPTDNAVQHNNLKISADIPQNGNSSCIKSPRFDQKLNTTKNQK